MNHNQHIQTIVHKQSDRARIDYHNRLNASLNCIHFLLQQGLAFRSHDENEDSSNKGNFLELLKFLLTSPDIQKDIVYAPACETTIAIMFDIGDDAFFSVWVDESGDISVKEQMTVVLRCVNTNRQVVERFVSIKHVPNTTAFSLKEAIDQLFSIGLSISRLRGQGYDEASNMQASCKHGDMVRERQQAKVMEAIQNYELPSGQSLNQETSLKRARDARWGSHYGTLVSLINMLSSVIEMLEMIVDDGVSLDQRGISSLAQKLLETKRDKQYLLVYLLVKLALILPVATASIERAFSVMKIVKNPHHVRMGDILE
ncbi:uncharacterized protein [Pyrus communis]|uniref:uncharacterized protein n=1 Tax=Pyrus communis TaxID=23211 RepID=UPI0035BF0B66